jgi:predicted component of type VI protein secretion system
MLVLEIVGARAGTLGRDSRCVFNATSGTIGRALDSTWILPEPWVSSTHARIEFAGEGFFLVDVSSNGVQSANPADDIQPQTPFLIRNRSRFFIGEFEIQATLLDADGLPIMDPDEQARVEGQLKAGPHRIPYVDERHR